MPSGYTSDIYDGKDVSFTQFALTAARGMGAAIMQRDDAPGPIADEYEPSDYHEKKLAEARKQVEQFKKLSLADWAKREIADREEMSKVVQESIRVAGERRVRYETMLAQVEAWRPPTPDHEGFKKFMTDQLQSSIDFDCSVTYLKMPPIRTPGEFRDEQIAKAEKDVAYHLDGQKTEIERTAGRNKWVRDLKESLGLVKADA